MGEALRFIGQIVASTGCTLAGWAVGDWYSDRLVQGGTIGESVKRTARTHWVKWVVVAIGMIIMYLIINTFVKPLILSKK